MTEAEGKMIALRQRIDEWRQNGGGKGSRMPEKLWKEAAQLAQIEGLYRASRELRLEYARLKSRVGRSKKQQRAQAPRGRRPNDLSAQFVEIEMKPSAIAGSGGHTVLELGDARGRRLRIDVNGSSTIDVVGLAQAFWSHQP